MTSESKIVKKDTTVGTDSITTVDIGTVVDERYMESLRYKSIMVKFNTLNPDSMTRIDESIVSKVGVHYPTSASWSDGDFVYLPATVRNNEKFCVLKVPKDVGTEMDIFKACTEYAPYLSTVPLDNLNIEQRMMDMQVPIRTRYFGPAYHKVASSKHRLPPLDPEDY
jgi:hypothetical protein